VGNQPIKKSVILISRVPNQPVDILCFQYAGISGSLGEKSKEVFFTWTHSIPAPLPSRWDSDVQGLKLKLK